MLEKLRFKFIALNMALATLVLVVVFSAICYLEHQSSVSEVLDVTMGIARTTRFPGWTGICWKKTESCLNFLSL